MVFCLAACVDVIIDVFISALVGVDVDGVDVAFIAVDAVVLVAAAFVASIGAFIVNVVDVVRRASDSPTAIRRRSRGCSV